MGEPLGHQARARLERSPACECGWVCVRCGFALLLLSMFVFYVPKAARTFFARCKFAAVTFCRSFCFAHGPPITQRSAPSCVHRSRHTLGVIHQVWSARPPRGVTVFANRQGLTDASTPQKQRRRCPPSHRLLVRSSRSHASTTHAPSRRLQRVSVACTRGRRRQAPRRRPCARRRATTRRRHTLATALSARQPR